MMHLCPKNGCSKQISESELSCSRHWYQVSKPTREAVWRAWRIGNVREHAKAVSLAVAEMNADPRS